MHFLNLSLFAVLPTLPACDFSAHDFSELQLVDLMQPIVFQNLTGEELDAPVEVTAASGTLTLGDRTVVLDDLVFDAQLDCTYDPAFVEMTPQLDSGLPFRLTFQQQDTDAGGLVFETHADDERVFSFSSGTLAMRVSPDCSTASGHFEGQFSGEVVRGSFVVTAPGTQIHLPR